MCLTIAAREEEGRLRIDVSDSGGNAAAARAGTGIGIGNVANRLRLHFGDEADFACGPLPGGGFAARIAIPIRRRR